MLSVPRETGIVPEVKVSKLLAVLIVVALCSTARAENGSAEQTAEAKAVSNASTARTNRFVAAIHECDIAQPGNPECIANASRELHADEAKWSDASYRLSLNVDENMRRDMYDAQQAYAHNPTYNNYGTALDGTANYINRMSGQ